MSEMPEIESEQQNDRALARIDELMRHDSLNDSDERELERLVNLVEAFEEKEYPIDPPDPITAINSEWSNKA